MYRKAFVIIIFLLVAPFACTQASTLYLEPNNSEHGLGDTFGINIRLNVDECVNTVEGYINFPSDLLRFVDFSSGQSIMSLWIKNPNKDDAEAINRDGKIYFAGGMPGGYCGKIPGDPGDSDIVGKIIFSVPGLVLADGSQKQAKISFLPESSVYLNDGLGTKDKLEFKDANIVILNKQSLAKEEWRQEIASDKLKPEPFIVELSRDPNLADGKYFIYFSTTDKQTGVDHYEVLEIAPDQTLGEIPQKSLLDIVLFREPVAPSWTQAVSPYVLKDQTLESVVRVKAIDKAGNERIVEYIPSVDIRQAVNHKSLLIKLIITSSIFLLLIIAIIIILKRRKKIAI